MKKEIAFLLAGLLLSQSAFPALAEELSEPFAAMSEMTEDVGGSENVGESEADTGLMAKEQESETEQEPKEETEAVETAETEAEEMPESGQAGMDEQKPAAETEEEEFIIEPDLIEPEEEPGKTEPDVAEAVPAASTENGVPIDEAHFPDADFRGYILSSVDYDGDGILSQDEIEETVTIDLCENAVQSIEGIEYFGNLETLYCYGNQLKKLDVSKNPKLLILECNDNLLTSLDVSKNPKLERLCCGYNELTSLDVSANSKLRELQCNQNILTNLDVNGRSELKELICSNNFLTRLDVSTNVNLEQLDCSGNRLTSLYVGKSSNLQRVECSNNKLTSLDMGESAALMYLSCSDNQLASLDVSRCPKLRELYCGNNSLKELHVENNSMLDSLGFTNNSLQQLDVTKNRKLRLLECDNNKLRELDLSNNPNLEYLSAHDNNFVSLDLSMTKKLRYWYIRGQREAYAVKSGNVWKVQMANIVGAKNTKNIAPTDSWSGADVAIKYNQGALEISPRLPEQIDYIYLTGSKAVDEHEYEKMYVLLWLKELKFVKDTVNLKVGESISLAGTVTGLIQGDSISRWRSFSPNIASVDAQGNVKALRAGQTYIAVGTKNGAVAKLLLNVQDTAVHTTAISGLHTGIALEAGKSVTLRPVLSPANSQDPVIYKSVAPNVATVSANGVVRGVRAGSAYVYVKSGTVYKKILVKVTASSLKAITGVRATGSLYVNATYQLRPQRYPVGSAGVFYYKSSNPAVAVVDKDGKITAKKQGSTVITVTARNVSTTMKLTVKQR